MAKIIQFDASKNRPEAVRTEKSRNCDHKQVIAYTVYRTVRCAICGTELDAFDVLVEILMAQVSSQTSNREEERLLKEVEKRNREQS